MAILDDNGFWVTYDSNRLIQRLTHDIQEYGSKQKVMTHIQDSAGARIYTDYEIIRGKNIEKLDNSEILTAGYLLKKLKQQNKMNLSHYF